MYKHFDILIIFILKVVMMFLSINILFDFDIDWLADWFIDWSGMYSYLRLKLLIKTALVFNDPFKNSSRTRRRDTMCSGVYGWKFVLGYSTVTADYLYFVSFKTIQTTLQIKYVVYPHVTPWRLFFSSLNVWILDHNVVPLQISGEQISWSERRPPLPLPDNQRVGLTKIVNVFFINQI